MLGSILSGMTKKNRDASPGRLAQLRTAYAMTKKADPRVPLIMIVAGLGVLGVFVALGFALSRPIAFAVAGVFAGVLTSMIIFARRTERAAYTQIEGQPGAAAAVLNVLRRGWTVTPAVAVTRNQDAVHLALGRPGIVLIGEGAPHRVASLLANEKLRMTRIAGEMPIHTVVAGNDDGQVPLRKLPRHLMKLPRALRPADVTSLNNRLRAVGGMTVPIPKGPLPQNIRRPRGSKIR